MTKERVDTKREFTPVAYGNVVLYKLTGSRYLWSDAELLLDERVPGRTLYTKRTIRYW